MVATQPDDWFPDVGCPDNTRVVNERCLVRIQGEHCVVIVAGIVLAQFAATDAMAAAYAMVNLVEQGWADQNDDGRILLGISHYRDARPMTSDLDLAIFDERWLLQETRGR